MVWSVGCEFDIVLLTTEYISKSNYSNLIFNIFYIYNCRVLSKIFNRWQLIQTHLQFAISIHVYDASKCWSVVNEIYLLHYFTFLENSVIWVYRPLVVAFDISMKNFIKMVIPMLQLIRWQWICAKLCFNIITVTILIVLFTIWISYV